MRREKDWPVFHGAPNSQPKIPKIKIFFFIVNNGLICILVMFIFIKTNLILQNCSFRSPTAEMKCKLWVTNEALQWLKKCYSKFLPGIRWFTNLFFVFVFHIGFFSIFFAICVHLFYLSDLDEKQLHVWLKMNGIGLNRQQLSILSQ